MNKVPVTQPYRLVNDHWSSTVHDGEECIPRLADEKLIVTSLVVGSLGFVSRD